MTLPRTDRDALAPESWINAGLSKLAAGGVAAIRVEALARDLKVTKGSFYWHFKSRDEFLTRMLETWRKRATIAVIQRFDDNEGPPQSRLRRLLEMPFASKGSQEGAQIELAVRVWGRTDPRTAAILQEVDEMRLAYLTNLFTLISPSGITPAQAHAKAVLAYSFQRVGPSLRPAEDNSNWLNDCIRELLGSDTDSA